MLNSLALLSLGLVGALTASAAPVSPPPRPAVRPAEPAVAVIQQSCGTHVVADDSDNGSSVCVVAGSEVSILLNTVTGSWSTPTGTGRVLGPAMPLPTPFGRVGWQFRTIAAGHAEIRTTRPSCPSPADCHDVLYQLHVTVR
jgi:hypothetical protein